MTSSKNVVLKLVLKLSYITFLRMCCVKSYIKVHQYIQLEPLKSETFGSFLMFSIHVSFEEIIADWNSDNLHFFVQFNLYG